MNKLFVQKFISISQKKKKRKKKIHYLSRYKLNQLLNQATDLFSLRQFFDSGKVTTDIMDQFWNTSDALADI